MRQVLCRLCVLFTALAVGLLGVVLVMVFAKAQSGQTPYSVNSGDFFFPPYPSENNRFGISVGGGLPIDYFDVAQLNAGWYMDWGATLNPPHPGQLEYARTIYLSVNTGPCSINKRPASIITEVSHITGSTLINNLLANPGALWMIGNEPDSIYNCSPIMPDTYAQVYHNLYTFIKQYDPSAHVVIGAIVQPTPLRLEYLDKVWDAYYRFYSTTLPTEMWNIHLYAFREVKGSWGAGVPPGATTNGMDYPMRDSVDMAVMSGLVEDMRGWMTAKGEQDKPLIITEYGVLWPADYCDGGVCFTEPTVAHYMTQTFDYFLTAVSPTLGYPADGYRLVQVWNWYSTNDKNIYNGDLFYLGSKKLSVIGQAFAEHTALLVRSYHDQALWTFSAVPAGGGPADVALKAIVTEMGNTPSSSATVRFYDAPPGSAQPISSHPIRQTLARYSLTAMVQSNWVATSPGMYSLSAVLVPGVDDANFANNTRTVSLDLRPDLAAAGLSLNLQPAGTLFETFTAVAHVTMTNEGYWPAHDVVAQLVVTDAQNAHAARAMTQTFSISPDQAIPLTFTWAMTQPGLYTVTLIADPGQTLDEITRANNTARQILDLRPDLALSGLAHVPAQPFLEGSPLPMTISARLSNVGAYPAHDTVTTLWVYNARSQSVYADEYTTASLLPGQSVPITFTWNVTRAGMYTFTLIASPGDPTIERNTANNLVARRVLVASHRHYLPVICKGLVTIQVSGGKQTQLETGFDPLLDSTGLDPHPGYRLRLP